MRDRKVHLQDAPVADLARVERDTDRFRMGNFRDRRAGRWLFATLYGRGRDIQDIDTAVEFNGQTCRWRMLGDVVDVHRSDERKAILSILAKADGPAREIVTAVVTLPAISNSWPPIVTL